MIASACVSPGLDRIRALINRLRAPIVASTLAAALLAAALLASEAGWAQTVPPLPPVPPQQAQGTPAPGAATPEQSAQDPIANQIRQQMQQGDPAAPVTLRLAATLTEDSPPLSTGLVWRIFAAEPDDNGTFRVIARSEDANPVFQLRAGAYVVHAAYGRANVTREVELAGGAVYDETLILNAGGLRLSATLADGTPIPPAKINFSVYSSELDDFGQRKLILPSATPGLIIRLNAATYFVVSQYGDANAIVRADVAVKAGELTEAVVAHSAANITLKLVNEPGGEALANTSWSILTPEGEIIAESVGAFPTHILAEGQYSAIARNESRVFNRDFSVIAGRNQEVELVAAE